jgi:hypothetical protein
MFSLCEPIHVKVPDKHLSSLFISCCDQGFMFWILDNLGETCKHPFPSLEDYFMMPLVPYECKRLLSMSLLPLSSETCLSLLVLNETGISKLTFNFQASELKIVLSDSMKIVNKVCPNGEGSEKRVDEGLKREEHNQHVEQIMHNVDRSKSLERYLKVREKRYRNELEREVENMSVSEVSSILLS